MVMIAVAAGVISGRHWVAQWKDTEIQPALVPQQRQTTATYERSSVDYNGNGNDDYTDIIAGARKDAEAAPQYDAGYYQGGYPPDDRGACTDLVWRAFREAGYDLKAMIDADIAADPASYASVAPAPDPNIDFRRVGVQQVFFAKYAQTLPTDINDISTWQAADIVVFGNAKHIGVISDKRDTGGLPYVLHNMGQRQRENDYLAFKTHMPVTGHYRFDASKVPANVLKAWQQ
ncbi:DUF1287 domain-containing protein [Bifidobacterium sp. LC6]|uniref:DUF1287 domain-containing protein n=2 Tax=Bifidobacterium colobi TaxID=2809026 RepID=A0ABS5UXG6_9BIFI|nr:DUF1287 domain-containing protein [Bifidobacterium colobi]